MMSPCLHLCLPHVVIQDLHHVRLKALGKGWLKHEHEYTFIGLCQGVVVHEDQFEPGQGGEGGQGVPEH